MVCTSIVLDQWAAGAHDQLVSINNDTVQYLRQSKVFPIASAINLLNLGRLQLYYMNLHSEQEE